jgi:hypothetical protein
VQKDHDPQQQRRQAIFTTYAGQSNRSSAIFEIRQTAIPAGADSGKMILENKKRIIKVGVIICSIQLAEGKEDTLLRSMELLPCPQNFGFYTRRPVE